MTSEHLDDQLESIPGVASAEVTLPIDGPPMARVFLDGTRSPSEVRERVEALLGSMVPRRPDRSDRSDREEPARRRRSGLGRGLGEVIEAHGAEARPAHLVGSAPAPVMIPHAQPMRVAVVEAGDGVHVEVEDSLGNRSIATVDQSIDDAIVRAVVELVSTEVEWEIRVADAATEHGEVVVVTARRANGERAAGAAVIEYGRPWAVARALVAALDR